MQLLVVLLIYLPILRRLDHILKRVLLGVLDLNCIFRDLVVVPPRVDGHPLYTQPDSSRRRAAPTY